MTNKTLKERIELGKQLCTQFDAIRKQLIGNNQDLKSVAKSLLENYPEIENIGEALAFISHMADQIAGVNCILLTLLCIPEEEQNKIIDELNA